jgi:hypothetical protein
MAISHQGRRGRRPAHDREIRFYLDETEWQTYMRAYEALHAPGESPSEVVRQLFVALLHESRLQLIVDALHLKRDGHTDAARCLVNSVLDSFDAQLQGHRQVSELLGNPNEGT